MRPSKIASVKFNFFEIPLKMSKLRLEIFGFASIIVFASTLPIEDSSSNSTSLDDGCVLIEDCKPLFWILKDLNSSWNETTHVINESLRWVFYYYFYDELLVKCFFRCVNDTIGCIITEPNHLTKYESERCFVLKQVFVWYFHSFCTCIRIASLHF